MRTFLFALFCLSISVISFAQETSKDKEIERLKLEIEKLRLENEILKNKSEQDFHPFIVNENGTITDTRSELMWTKYDFGNTMNPTSIPKDCEVGGYNDWRLPSRIELKGLYNSLGMMTKYIATDPNDRTIVPFEWQGSMYWSGDAGYDVNRDYTHYRFDFKTGKIRIFDYDYSPNFYVRLVRNN